MNNTKIYASIRPTKVDTTIVYTMANIHTRNDSISDMVDNNYENKVLLELLLQFYEHQFFQKAFHLVLNDSHGN